jgi:hypothetical protein
MAAIVQCGATISSKISINLIGLNPFISIISRKFWTGAVPGVSLIDLAIPALTNNTSSARWLAYSSLWLSDRNNYRQDYAPIASYCSIGRAFSAVMSDVCGQNVTNRAKVAELRTTPPLGKRDRRVIQMFSVRKFAGQRMTPGHR